MLVSVDDQGAEVEKGSRGAMEVTRLLPIQGEVQIIDVRQETEWESGHIAGSRHIPLDRLPEGLDEIDRDKPVVTVCRTGPRSAEAASILQSAGLSADHLEGGLTAWAERGQPLVDWQGNPGWVEGSEQEPQDPELASLQEDMIEIVMAIQQRFEGREPSEEEAKAFMREWLEQKGRSAEEIDFILAE